MTKIKYHGVGIGSTSILMVFVVLCLTTFSVLSYSSANSTRKFSEKTAEQTVYYNLANTEANERLAEIDLFLYNLPSNAELYNSGMANIIKLDGVILKENYDYFIVSFRVSITEMSSLNVELAVPFSPQDERYSITKWSTESEMFNYADQPGNIWDGNNLQ